MLLQRFGMKVVRVVIASNTVVCNTVCTCNASVYDTFASGFRLGTLWIAGVGGHKLPATTKKLHHLLKKMEAKVAQELADPALKDSPQVAESARAHCYFLSEQVPKTCKFWLFTFGLLTVPSPSIYYVVVSKSVFCTLCCVETILLTPYSVLYTLRAFLGPRTLDRGCEVGWAE